MTFRIDEVRQRNGEWVFGIKGVKGEGVYGTLITDDDGRGLYLMDAESVAPPTTFPELISPEAFHVPIDTTREEASRLLAIALHRLGWGPEVGQRNRPLQDMEAAIAKLHPQQ